jgi:AraC family transcriptional regulator
MNYKIVEREAFQVYGIEGIFDTKDGENLWAIPEFWSEAMKNGEYRKLAKSANCPSIVNAVCGYRKLEGTKFPYMLCVMKTPLSETAGYTVADVPSATWAIFWNEPHRIEDTSMETQKLISRVYTEWLPTAGFDILEGYEFEMYYDQCDGTFYEEAWFRVVPGKRAD